MVTTAYYIVAVDSGGDVLATPATVVARGGIDITVRTTNPVCEACAFENQGDDGVSQWESARDALARIMPAPERR